MPDWFVIALFVVVVLAVLIVIAWWWTHRRPRAGVGSAGAAASATAAVDAAPLAASVAGPYGPGSAASLSDGNAPAGFAIKGNADSMLYHTPASPYYGRTKAEAWFQTEADAVRAGFARWDAKKPG
jgi:hypothetical protein